LNCLISNRISHLNPIECGLCHLHFPTQYTEQLLLLLAKWFDAFKVGEDLMVQIPSDLFGFEHEDLYTLIMPNLYDPVFEYQVKTLFDSYFRTLIDPLLQNVIDKLKT
jgi:hypothetical protein